MCLHQGGGREEVGWKTRRERGMSDRGRKKGGRKGGRKGRKREKGKEEGRERKGAKEEKRE